jgi:hypothetical protein
MFRKYDSFFSAVHAPAFNVYFIVQIASPHIDVIKSIFFICVRESYYK